MHVNVALLKEAADAEGLSMPKPTEKVVLTKNASSYNTSLKSKEHTKPLPPVQNSNISAKKVRFVDEREPSCKITEFAHMQSVR